MSPSSKRSVHASIDHEAVLKAAWEPVEAGEMERGTPVLIHTVDRGARQMMRDEARRLQAITTKWIKENWPLECWKVKARESNDPLGGYEVYAEFHGAMPSVQMVGKWKAQCRRERRAKSRSSE